MSKHIFEQTINDQTYEVQIGWDKPCQRFYGVISPWVEDVEYEEGGYFDDPLWSNIFYQKSFALEDIVHICEEYGFTLPDGLVEKVYLDQQRNAVNEITYYGEVEPRHHNLNKPEL